MAILPPNQLLHLGPDPAGGTSTWNHFDLGQGLTTHINYPQAQLGNSPPQGAPWWYSKSNVDGRDVAVFSAPLGGATTSTNTQYSRDELREYERDGTTKMAFDPKSGDHWIEGIYRIYGLSGLQKPGVCVQQMHDPNDDVIMVRTELSGGVPKLMLKYNGTQIAVLNANYVDGTEFYLKTRVNNGTPSIYYTTNLASIPTTPINTSAGYFSGASTGWYSKTGSYNQTNESTDPNVDPDASIIKVEVRELKHWHSQTPLGGAWPTPATYATTGGTGGPVVSAGADVSMPPSATFSRTASVTLNGATLNSQLWKILSGPAGAGNTLSTAALCNWTPSTGYTTTGGTRGLGVGGIAAPAPASNVELNTSDRGDMNITASGTAAVPRIYDGGGHTCGRITISANYIIIQNYNIRPNSQYAVYITGSNVTVQNCDIKNVSVSGDGDLNAITLLEGSNIDILYNTAINYVSGDPGGSHTDFIQTWVSSSHPTPVNNVRVIGNKATGPSNPSRDNSIPSIHQLIMVESAGHGGNSGGSGTPSNWLICDNEWGASWGQDIKLDGGNNFTFTRNKFVGSSDHVFSFDAGTGNVVYSDNTFGSGYGNVNATITSGSGPANPISGGGTTTNPYPEGTYLLEFDAVTSAGTVSDTVTVVVTSTPGGGGGGGGTPGGYPSFVAVGNAASSDGSGTVTVPAPAGMQNGMFQICIVQNPGTESYTAIPAGWAILDDENIVNADFGQPGGDSSTTVFYNTTGDTASRSWTKSGSRGYHAVRMAWRDQSALGQHSSRASAYTTTPYAPQVTPAVDTALVVTIMGSDRTDIGPSPVSVPTGWTSRYNAGVTVNINEIQWIAVAELQVANRVLTGGNVPGGTGVATSNFTLTNPDNGAMFSFVLEGGVGGSGTTLNGAVSLNAQATLATQGINTAKVALVATATLFAMTTVRAAVTMIVQKTLVVDARVFLRGTLLINTSLTFTPVQVLTFPSVQLQAVMGFWVSSLPYRRPVLRTDYKYPPRNHPFRLIAQRILDGEIVDWELPVDEDFEYVEQLSGPVVMKGSFRPEQISVQELMLDGYAYWLHVEINQQIRASAILLPLQFQDSTMSFSAEGIAAAPHYQIYDGVYRMIQVDPLSIVRTIWNYVQSQPQSDYGVVLSGNSSPVRLGDPATTETTVTDNGDGTTTTTIRDIPAKPYELVWWNATNCGEEIDTLSSQTPFDYVERNEWNRDRTDVLHYIDMGYPRIGVALPDLLFNEENILEVVPIQELEDSYASAVLVIGAGEGEDTIRGYAAQSFGDRVRKEVVITDKTITTGERAYTRALTELAARRGRAFEISEIVIAAYHTNAPVGSYKVGDDIRVAVDIPWLMETHTAWYRITSITNKPSSDKVRLGLAHAGTFDNTQIQVIDIDDYVPFEPPPPAGPQEWPGYVQLIISADLTTDASLIPALIGALSLTVGKTLAVGGFVSRSGAVTLTIGKTFSVAGIATAANAATASFIINKTLTIGGIQVEFAAVSLGVTSTLTTVAVTSKIGAVSLGVTSSLMVGTGVPGGAVALTVGKTLTVISGGVSGGAVALTVGKTLTAGGAITQSGAVTLTVGKTLTAGALLNMVGAITMTVLKSLGTDGTVSGGTVTTQLGKQTDGSASSSSSGNKTTVSKFTATATGTITAGHSRLWVDSGTASIQMVVYADSSGNPGALLGLSDALTVSNTAEAQKDFTFTGGQQASITSGVDYWLGFTWADPGTNNITWSRDTTSGAAQQNSSVAANPFGTPTSASGPIDTFVDVVSVGGGGGGGGTLPVIRSVSGGGKTDVTDTSFLVPKPAGLAVGDYMLALYSGDADSGIASMTSTGFSSLGSRAGGTTSNFPAAKVLGKVATSGDVAATNFTFNADTAGDGAVLLVAITAGTYDTNTPITMSGTFTTQARTSSMVQTAPSMTGIVNGLLLGMFCTDTNGVTESYPSGSPPSGMTLVGSQQGVPGGPYAMVGAYKQALSSTAATGSKTVSPTPSGITTNGWTTTSLIVNPA